MCEPHDISILSSLQDLSPFKPPLYNFEDYVASSRSSKGLLSVPPILSLLITVYSDATFVDITVPHIFCDSHGFYLICKAWAETLEHGSPALIPDLSFDDPLGRSPSSELPLNLPQGWFQEETEEKHPSLSEEYMFGEDSRRLIRVSSKLLNNFVIGNKSVLELYCLSVTTIS